MFKFRDFLTVFIFMAISSPIMADITLGDNPEDGVFSFFVTADTQYHTADTSKANANSENSTATLNAIKNKIKANLTTAKGLIIAGDLTQRTRKDEKQAYDNAISEFSNVIYDGQGNHDDEDPEYIFGSKKANCYLLLPHCRSEQWFINTIRDRDRQTTIYKSKATPYAQKDDIVGAQYYWKWEGIHFLQLGTFIANRINYLGHFPQVDPHNSLWFLKERLDKITVGEPIILVSHYPLYGTVDKNNIVGNGKENAWTTAQVNDMWNALGNHNVVAMFSGHMHLDSFFRSWHQKVTRPSTLNTRFGPEYIDNFIGGAALNGIYLQANVDNGQMLVSRYDRYGNLQQKTAIAVDVSVKPKRSPYTASNGVIPRLHKRNNSIYRMKIRASENDCSLEWDATADSDNERNAKFDCMTEGDPVEFQPTKRAVIQDGVITITGKIYNLNGCGLQYEGGYSTGERTAKFDCSSDADADPITIERITTTEHAPMDVKFYVQPGSIGYKKCYLQWTFRGTRSSDRHLERDAKFDCGTEPGDGFYISELQEIKDWYLSEWMSSVGDVFYSGLYGKREYFRLKKKDGFGGYSAFPTNQKDNEYWEYIR